MTLIEQALNDEIGFAFNVNKCMKLDNIFLSCTPLKTQIYYNSKMK